MTTIFVFDTPMIRIFGWITQNLFQKSEFNCKVQLSRSNLFLCPKCTSCPYVVFVRSFPGYTEEILVCVPDSHKLQTHTHTHTGL